MEKAERLYLLSSIIIPLAKEAENQQNVGLGTNRGCG
jgi:hypothetical protein